MTDISIVIPTFNSARTLDRCLSSIDRQTVPVRDVVVVDDLRTNDDTRSIADRHGARVVVSPAGMAESRNEGTLLTDTSYVFSVDSDMVLAERVVEHVLRHFADTGDDAVSIKEVVQGPGYWTRCRAVDKQAVELTGYGRSIRAFTRTIFDRVAGYDTTLEAGEDLDFHLRVAGAGARIGHVSTSEIIHDEGRVHLIQAAKKKFRYGKSVADFNTKHGGARLTEGFGTRLRAGVDAATRDDPLAIPGFIGLKACEGFAALAGRVAAGTHKQRADAN